MPRSGLQRLHEYHSGGTAGKVDVAQPSDHNYRPDSVRQQKIRGSYGRYLTFTGTTLMRIPAPRELQPRFAGSTVCDTTVSPDKPRVAGMWDTWHRVTHQGVPVAWNAEASTTNWTAGIEPSTAGRLDGFANKGWMNVGEDPTALAVANRYCPIIDSLPKPFDPDDDL